MTDNITDPTLDLVEIYRRSAKPDMTLMNGRLINVYVCVILDSDEKKKLSGTTVGTSLRSR